LFSGVRIPDSRGPVGTAGREPALVRTERDSVHLFEVRNPDQRLATDNVPDLDIAVGVTRGQPSAVWSERHRPHSIAMGDLVPTISRAAVPQLDYATASGKTPRGEHVRLRAERDPVYPCLSQPVLPEGKTLTPAGSVEDLYRVGSRGDGEATAIAAESERVDLFCRDGGDRRGCEGNVGASSSRGSVSLRARPVCVVAVGGVAGEGQSGHRVVVVLPGAMQVPGGQCRVQLQVDGVEGQQLWDPGVRRRGAP